MTKPLEVFVKPLNINKKGVGKCRACQLAREQELREIPRIGTPVEDLPPKMCTHCGETKPQTEFSRIGVRYIAAICKECVRRRTREYNRTHPKSYRQLEAVREKTQRAHARRVGAPLVERVDRIAIIERDGSRCYLWCGRVLQASEITLDHVIPLRRGGVHTANNLRVACRRCNQRKGTKLLEELTDLPQS